mmetsp:Transcript_64631/g.142531  ORF Transcript_64631/g.142531 Transcript_64631/m.142531 type:complete len:214 (-) Transcript_64631:80-721(-)
MHGHGHENAGVGHSHGHDAGDCDLCASGIGHGDEHAGAGHGHSHGAHGAADCEICASLASGHGGGHGASGHGSSGHGAGHGHGHGSAVAARSQEQAVAEQFCQHYYATFDRSRQELGALYRDSSMLTFEGEQYLGATNIVAKLVSLPFQRVQHQVVGCDCQSSPPGKGVVIMVVGHMLADDNQSPFKFAQVFQLIQGAGGNYFCQNDMFRLVH